MKIVLLCWRDLGHPQGGGSERYLEEVARYAASKGHEVIFRTAAYPGAPAREEIDGVVFERAGGRLSVYPRAVLGLPRDADVVVDTQNGVPFFARLGTRAPVVVLTHHCHREQWPVAGRLLGRLGWFLESKVSPALYRGSRYVTVSLASKAELVALGVRPEAIQVIRNGISPAPAGRDEPSGRVVVLSRLVPHKQLEHVIDMARELTHLKVDVIGSGWWETHLKERAADVADRVVFHGHVSETRKHELLARASVHVMPSRKEGWGLAVVEAAQHGVPTVGYRSAGGLVESVADGGVLVDSKQELITATATLLADDALRNQLGDAARRRAAGYSWERTGEEFLAFLEEVAGTSQAKSQHEVRNNPSQ